MAAGEIKFKRSGTGQYAAVHFDESQFQVDDSAKTEPLAAATIDDNKTDDQVPPGKPADDEGYGHSLDLNRLDEWTTGALKDARAQWMLPARTDGYGVPTNAPDKNSSTRPTPEHAALWARSGAILQERAAHNGEIPKHTLRKPHGYWPSDPNVANHNNRVATLGQAETTEECHNWVKNQGRPSSNDNPLRQMPEATPQEVPQESQQEKNL
jgi:hypothetical protein